MALQNGTRFGPYQVLERIGAGGMGEVWRAQDTTLKRDVAVKALPESFATDADRLARFRREAEILASLNHPNIATIYGLEQSEGQTVIVMELVAGPTLADRIAEGPIPADEALAIARQVADALEAAHGRQIVHRDLKPANIKLRDDGTVKVLDFGISKPVDARAISGGTPVMTTPAVTQTGVILGTAAYMSPEQARGRPVDQRTDIWAFGCLLFEMLTGQPAFGGEDVMITLARVLDRDTDLTSMPGSVSAAVRHTIRLCLQKDPDKRISDIRDVRLALRGAFESGLPQATGAGMPPASSRTVATAAMLIAGIGIASAVTWALTRPAPTGPAPVSRFVETLPPETPLASLGGYDVAISPDGTTLAYFVRDVQSGSVNLYVRELDSLDARMLPDTEIRDPGGGNMNPFFSPDGQWIGFRSPGRGIMRVAIDGRPPIKILDDVPVFLGASWYSNDMLVYSDNNRLFRVSVNGGGMPEPLTEAQDGFVGGPVMLPGDDAVLAALVNDSGEHAIIFDVATGEPKPLMDGTQNLRYLSTGHLAFVRDTTLMAVPFDPERREVAGEPVALLQGVRHPSSQTAADWAVSDNGTLVYVPGDAGEAQMFAIVWVDREGRVVEPALTETLENPREPALSPDGERLAVITGRRLAGSLWIHDLRGRPPIPISPDGNNLLPAWSPDGSRLAYESNASGSWDLYAVPANGSALDPEPLRAEPYDAAAFAWTADDRLVVIDWVRSQATELSEIGLEAGSEVRSITTTDFAEGNGDLSPDGRWLAFASTRTGQPEVWVMAYPDGVPVRVSRAGGREPVWSHDGTELFYLQGNTMMGVPVVTTGDFSFGASVEFFSEPFWFATDATTASYDVASDGRFLMIQPLSDSAGGQDSKIVIVQNWFEEVRQLAPVD